MSRPAPRRPSRTTTPKPRKIAGRDPATADAPPAAAPSAAAPAGAAATTPPAPEVAPAPPTKPTPRPPRAMPPPTTTTPVADEPASARSGATFALLVVLGICVLLLVLQGLWFIVHSNRNESPRLDAGTSQTDDTSSGAPISVPSGRPVVLNEAAVQEGVDAAASAASVMFARSWKTYDDGVDDAVTLMTDEFAKQYRATTDDVRKQFIARKTEVEVRVIAQSVVRANADELQALIFLNQYIVRGEGKDAKTTYTPYRALFTMVHTDEGWLVDNLDTK